MISLMLLSISYIFECHYVIIDPSPGVRLYFHLEKFGIYIKMLQDKVIKLSLSFRTINFFTNFVFVGTHILKTSVPTPS